MMAHKAFTYRRPELRPDSDRAAGHDPVPVVWANFYDDGYPSVHYTEAAARRHADADPVDVIEVAVPLYRQAQP